MGGRRVTSQIGRGPVLFALAALVVGLGAWQLTVPVHADATQIVSVSGWMNLGGAPASVDVVVAVPDGADAQGLEQQALDLVHASSTPPSDLFTTFPAVWDQFFDHGRQNDTVVQFYNPAGDPTGGGGLAALTAAQQAWSSVDNSSFRYTFGGTTTRCPSLVFLCPGGSRLDGQNDVGWVDFGPRSFILGIAETVFNPFDGTILESDVALSRNPPVPWTSDGSSLDLQTAFTHEDGHVAGLGHSPDPAAVMFPFLSIGQIKRTLTADDADGLRFLYPTKPSTVVLSRAAYGFRILDELGAANDRLNDYELGGLDGGGEAAFVADVPQGEGVFLSSSNGVRELVRSGDQIAGLTLTSPGVSDRIGTNTQGDVAFAFMVGPFALPFGLGAALFHYHATSGAIEAVVRPGATPAPGGGVFRGVVGARISNSGEIVFGGLVDTPRGPTLGAFRVAPDGAIDAIARPGDQLPGGTTLSAAFPALNDRGDAAFEATLAGDRGTSLFLRHADSGTVERLARSGDPAPGGGFMQSARRPDINARGDVVFAGDLTHPPRSLRTLGLFLHTATGTAAVATPGELMPDGERLFSVGRISFQFSLNDASNVAFVARVGFGQTAVYRSSGGGLELVARSGMVIPGIGQMVQLQPPSGLINPLPVGGALIDARGDVLFQAVTFAGRPLLLVANPKA